MNIMKLTLIILTVLSGLSSCVLLWLIRHAATPKILDFIVGVQLILSAAFFLGLLGDLRGLLPNDNSLKAGYDVALLIIPFFTAGIGTNIISNVFLAERNYEKATSTKVIFSKSFFYLVIAISVVFPPVLILYVLLQKTKQNKKNGKALFSTHKTKVRNHRESQRTNRSTQQD